VSEDVDCGDSWISLSMKGPVTDAACRDSRACKQCGYCTERGRTCRATSPADCQKAPCCEDDGRCGLARDGTCVATDEGCKASRMCDFNGSCTPRDGYCVATAESCRRIFMCGTDGRCGEKDGACVVTAQGCKESVVCVQEGRCRLEEDACVK
jgi:hypothetical protein